MKCDTSRTKILSRYCAVIKLIFFNYLFTALFDKLMLFYILFYVEKEKAKTLRRKFSQAKDAIRVFPDHDIDKTMGCLRAY